MVSSQAWINISVRLNPSIGKLCFVSGIVLQEAAILAVLGFIPGVAVANWLYGKAAAATNLPLYMTQERATTVFLMTLTMCAISGLLAMRKVRKLDPAEVF